MSPLAISLVAAIALALGFLVGYFIGHLCDASRQRELTNWIEEYQKEIELCNGQYRRIGKWAEDSACKVKFDTYQRDPATGKIILCSSKK